MKNKQFRKTANEMIDNPILSQFEKTFCELCCIADEDKFQKLIKAFPDVVEKITHIQKDIIK